MKFFCDNNLSPKIARALHCLVQPDHEVIHLRDRFPASATDLEWINALASEDSWVIISADTSIARNPHEREAWGRSGHPLFFYKHALLHQTLWQQTSRLCHVFPDIIRFSERAQPGDSFQIPVRGVIERL